MMGGLEQNSNHPLAAGILREAHDQNIKLSGADDVKNVPGVGLEGTLGGKKLSIVSASYLDRNNLPYDKQVFAELSGKGYTVSFLAVDGKVAGLAAQGDEIKPHAKEMIDALKQRNIRPVMLTGDNEAAAQAVAKSLGIDDVHASPPAGGQGTHHQGIPAREPHGNDGR